MVDMVDILNGISVLLFVACIRVAFLIIKDERERQKENDE